MVQKQPTQVSDLYPYFAQYQGMVAREIADLTETQLDWESDQWEWAVWSIRRDISHVTSHLFRQYLLPKYWGDVLFPTEKPFAADVHDLAALPTRRLHEDRWWAIEAIMEKLEQGLAIVQEIMACETLETIQEKTIIYDNPPGYHVLAHWYPGTCWPHPDLADHWVMTLEGSLHHSECELITHLYNIQRHKRAQGILATVPLPPIGYWTLKEWDRSEP
jgi:hypothetical protein